MRKAGVLVVCLGVAIALYVSFTQHRPAPSPETVAPPTPASQNAAVAAALARQSPNTAAIIQSNFARVQPGPVNPAAAAPGTPARSPVPPSQPLPLQFTNFPPAVVVQNMSRAVRQYGEMFGGNPVGTNPEITAALTGKNPRHLDFLNAESGMRTNPNGELIDPWGTPYFFHQLSGRDMEIHSAGPDGIMWTADDLVAN